jgi:hypothetical protein
VSFYRRLVLKTGDGSSPSALFGGLVRFPVVCCSVVVVLLKLALFCCRFFFFLWSQFIASFLAPFVCFFGFWFSGFSFRSVEICRDQNFQFCICGARKFGKAYDSGLARNGLVLVAALASSRWLSLFPC